jgi:hypothetical protein
MVPEEITWPAGSGNAWSQMPTIPWALQTIYNETGDVSFLKEQVPKVAAYLEWWRTTRDLGDGLVVTVHPWEVGIDASPAFDAPWHFSPTGVAAVDFATLYLKFPELKSYYSSTWSNNFTAVLDQTEAASSLLADWFVVQDIAINTLVAVGWAVLGDLAAEYDAATAKTYYAKNEAHEAAMIERMWDSSLERFVTTYKDQDGTWQSTSLQTVQSLFPLLMRSLSAEQRAAVVADVTDESKFWTEYPFPSVPSDLSVHERSELEDGIVDVAVDVGDDGPARVPEPLASAVLEQRRLREVVRVASSRRAGVGLADKVLVGAVLLRSVRRADPGFCGRARRELTSTNIYKANSPTHRRLRQCRRPRPRRWQTASTRR